MELIADVKKHKMLWEKSSRNHNDKIAINKAWETIAKNNGMLKMDAKRKWRNLRDTFIRELRKYPQARPGNSGKYNGKWKYFSSMMFLRDEIILRSIHDNTLETNESMSSRRENSNISETYDSNIEPDYEDPLDVEPMVKKESDTESVGRLKRIRDCPTNIIELQVSEEYDNKKHSTLEREREESASISSDTECSPKRKNDCCKEYDNRNLAIHHEERESESALFLRSLNSYFKNFTPLQQVRVQGKILDVIMKELELNALAQQKHY